MHPMYVELVSVVRVNFVYPCVHVIALLLLCYDIKPVNDQKN